MSSTRTRSGIDLSMESSIPFTTAYTAIVMTIYRIGEALTGLHPYQLTDIAATRVGLGTDAGLADIMVTLISSN